MAPKARVWLVHWNAAEAEPKTARLREAGFDAVHLLPRGSSAMRRALREDAPAAMVIDLGRLPAQGRDVAFGLRQAKATRAIPIVFAGGQPDKVALVRSALPDALYTDWEAIEGALTRALASPPEVTVVPRSVFDVYAGTPLVTKLGIRANARVLLADPPEGFDQEIGALPEGALLTNDPAAGPNLIVWFASSPADLQPGVRRLLPLTDRADLWVAWPKQTAAAHKSGLTQAAVRRAGLAAGLVDFKIIAIDGTWSALRFTRRKPAGAART